MKKTNNITGLEFILDRSGSMAGLKSDTIGGAIHHIANIHKYARRKEMLTHNDCHYDGRL